MTGAWCYLHNGVPGGVGASCICGRSESFALARIPQPSQQRKATDEEIAAWAERHDLGISSATDRRSALEDAQTLCGAGLPPTREGVAE